MVGAGIFNHSTANLHLDFATVITQVSGLIRLFLLIFLNVIALGYSFVFICLGR